MSVICKTNVFMEKAKCFISECRNDCTLIELNIKNCCKYLHELKVLLEKCKSIGDKNHIINCMCLIKGYRTQLKELRITTGSGYKKPNPNWKNYVSTNVKWEDIQSAFKNQIRSGAIINLHHKDPRNFLVDCSKVFNRKIKKIFKNEWAIKVYGIFSGEFKIFKNDSEIVENKYMNTKSIPFYNNSVDINEWFNENIMEPILKKLEEFQEKDSGWTLSLINHLNINISKFNPQAGSSYIDLPAVIKNKHACINVKNNDDACFAWAIVSALFPAKKSPKRTSSYPHWRNILNFEEISFPTPINQLSKFEVQNGISINVYILNKNMKNFTVHPAYLSKDKKDKHINLLMLQNEYYNDDNMGLGADINDDNENQHMRYHYVWIKNLSRLLSSQLSKHNGSKYFCDRCLHYFYSKQKLATHYEDCINQNNCRIRLPTDAEKILKFKNFSNKEKAPFIIYADLECILQRVNNANNINNNTNEYQNHIPYNIGFYVKCSYDPTLSFYKCYRSRDCIEWFTRELLDFVENVETIFLCDLPMNQLTEEEISQFKTAKLCHICERLFTDNDMKVHDHCHLTGKYRGPAHEGCNMNFKNSHIIPVVFHNLSGYDSHFIIKNLASDLEGRINLLPINKERYISFTKNLDEHIVKLRFIDSYRFLSSSLDALASYLPAFPILNSQFSNLNENQFNLLKRKGIYPYDYMDDENKFLETCLPTINSFCNKLNDTNISLDEYYHANTVWNEFNIQNLGDYTNLYLKTDILLLADIFEQFRNSSIETYGLDPAHYYTLPGFTWDAMLKFTDQTLELLTDIDMLMFVEKGVRGGLSQCSKRYSKANNKYMADYNSNLQTKYLMYYDINNQYGWAMSQYLPYGGFKWSENIKQFTIDNINELSDDSNIGYIFEVDLEYPQEIHEKHRDLPFCSQHCSAPNSKQEKLMSTLYSKMKYVIHYRNLKQALKNGLKLVKVHRILEFKQSSWLKSYIDLNTKLRAQAKNEFEKNLFKLMNNAVFGKTMENVRKYSIVKLVTKWVGRYGAEALICKPQFKTFVIFNENLVAIELNKTEIYFNKPIYVGMCILDLAKTTIYNFHYDYMWQQFGTNCTICYTDTDSLIYEVTCSDIYETIKKDCKKYFDTSDYSINNIWGIPQVNKKVLGLMKDENNGRIMTEFIGLRSKMYSIRVEGNEETKKSKGVKRHIIKNRLRFDDYMDCLNYNVEKTVSQNLIQSRKHQVSSISQTKIALSPYDDKRFLINSAYETLPWGHCSIIDID